MRVTALMFLSCRVVYVLLCSGLPFAGLDEYVHMSDFINLKLDPGTLQELDTSPIIGGKFSNFLNVRQNEIRLVPNNCWTRGFADYLKETSKVAKVTELLINIYCTYILIHFSLY